MGSVQVRQHRGLPQTFCWRGWVRCYWVPCFPQWHTRGSLRTRRAGFCCSTKFVGAFLGGVTVPRRLGLGIFVGSLLAFAGFGAFALSRSLLPGCIALFVSGIGLGQIIASTNILTGRRYRTHTGSALASLNFFWSLGAVITGILVAAFIPRYGLTKSIAVLCGALFSQWHGRPAPAYEFRRRRQERICTDAVACGEQHRFFCAASLPVWRIGDLPDGVDHDVYSPLLRSATAGRTVGCRAALDFADGWPSASLPRAAPRQRVSCPANGTPAGDCRDRCSRVGSPRLDVIFLLHPAGARHRSVLSRRRSPSLCGSNLQRGQPGSSSLFPAWAPRSSRG